MQNQIIVFLLFSLTCCVLQLNAQRMQRQNNQLVSSEIDGEKFALDLLVKLANQLDSTTNIVFSPWSIRALLLMLLEGADGNTAAELRRALFISTNIINARNRHKLEIRAMDNAKSSTIDIMQASGVFVDQQTPPKNEYSRIIAGEYKASVYSVNFAEPKTAIAIDKFISHATNNRITEVIHDSDLQGAELIALNAIYFKGGWKYPFNKTGTYTDKFYDDYNNPIADVEMMSVLAPFTFSVVSAIGARAAALPYGDDEKVSMIIVIPFNNNTADYVTKRLASLGMATIYKAFENAVIMYEGEDVALYLPKFSSLSDLNLNSIMEQMGVNDIFEPDRANLKKMSDRNIFLATVLHKAEIEVNEEGTVASAASSGQVNYKTHPPKLFANRPFLYFIVENDSKTILFAGKYANPRQGK